MGRINLGANDERVIVDALEGYARFLAAKRAKAVNLNAPAALGGEISKLTSDHDRAERLARVIKTWRASAGPAPDVESDYEDDEGDDE